MHYAGRLLIDALCAAHRNPNTEKPLLESHSNLLEARHDVVDFIVAYVFDNTIDSVQETS